MTRSKHIAGIIILFIAVFLLIGFVNRSVEFRHDMNIDRPVQVVYFTMMNPMKMDQWVYGFEKLESLDGFLNGPGSRYLLTLKIGKREIVILEEVTTFNWKKDLGLKFDMGHMLLFLDIEFIEKGKSCDLVINTRVEGTGLLSRSLATFSKPLIKKHIERNFEGLKNILE